MDAQPEVTGRARATGARAGSLTRRVFGRRPARTSTPSQTTSPQLSLSTRTTRLQPQSNAVAMSAAVMTTEVETSSAPRRKSGRVSKPPAKFVPASSPAGSAKRKRSADHEDSDVDRDGISSDEESQENGEGEPDVEELKERRRKKTPRATAKKPASKKPKTNGETVSLAIRPASGVPKKPRKPRKAPVRKSAFFDDAEGLYGKHISSLKSNWIELIASQLRCLPMGITFRISLRNGSRDSTSTKPKP